MMQKNILTLLFLLTVLAPSAYSQTAMYGGDIANTSFYESTLPDDMFLQEAWQFKTRGKIYGSAVVARNLVIIGSMDSSLYAINKDGTLEWEFRSNGPIRSTPAVKDDRVYFRNFSGTFYALDINTGEEVWNIKNPRDSIRAGYGLNWTDENTYLVDEWDFFTSSPAIYESHAYMGIGRRFYAINLETKEIDWTFVATDLVHSSPAIWEEKVYFGAWDGRVFSLDIHTGEVVWIFKTKLDLLSKGMQGIQGSPTVIENKVYVASRDGSVYGFNGRNGTKVMEIIFNTWMPGSFALLNDTLYTGSYANRLFAIDRANQDLFYSLRTESFVFSSPSITNKYAFIGSMDGTLYGIDIANRKLIYEYDTKARKRDYYNVLREDGSVNKSIFDNLGLNDYVDRLETLGSILSTPVIDEDYVIFGSTDSTVYVLKDAGECKPQLSIQSQELLLGKVDTDGSCIDTAIYIVNNSECHDSIKLSTNMPFTLFGSVSISVPDYVIPPGDSAAIEIILCPDGLSDDNYNISVTVQSQINELMSFDAIVNFKVGDVTDIEEKQVPEQLTGVYPNPVKDIGKVTFNLQKPGLINIRILNLYGQTVKNIAYEQFPAGEHTVSFATSDMPAGTYLVQMTSSRGSASKKITVLQ